MTRLSFTKFWSKYGTPDIHPDHAKYIWTAAQASALGWGLEGQCRECGTRTKPRAKGDLCRTCYQRQRVKGLEGEALERHRQSRNKAMRKYMKKRRSRNLN